jgi:hypothetical protein
MPHRLRGRDRVRDQFVPKEDGLIEPATARDREASSL